MNIELIIQTFASIMGFLTVIFLYQQVNLQKTQLIEAKKQNEIANQILDLEKEKLVKKTRIKFLVKGYFLYNQKNNEITIMNTGDTKIEIWGLYLSSEVLLSKISQLSDERKPVSPYNTLVKTLTENEKIFLNPNTEHKFEFQGNNLPIHCELFFTLTYLDELDNFTKSYGIIDDKIYSVT